MGLFKNKKKKWQEAVDKIEKRHTVELNKEQELIYNQCCLLFYEYKDKVDFIKTIFDNVKEGGYLYIPVFRKGDNISKCYIIKNIKQIKIDTAFRFIITGTPTDILYDINDIKISN